MSVITNIVLTKTQLQLEEAVTWYTQQEVKLGKKLYDSYSRQLHRITVNPEQYAVRERGIREAPLKDFPYNIIYRYYPKNNTVIVSSFFHTSRNPSKKYRKQ